MKGKRFFCVLTAILLLLVSAVLTACGTEETAEEQRGENGAETKPFSMAVISDIHLLASSEIADVSCKSYTALAASKQRMLSLSEPIFRTAADDIIASGVDVLLVTGDMTENGSKASVEVLREEFERLEQAGVTVCVTTGIYDMQEAGLRYEGDEATETPAIKREEFPEYFAKYGYGEALTRDTASQSYVVDLPNGNYRLLVIESTSRYEFNYDEPAMEYAEDTPKVSDEQMEYIETSLMQAEEDGKEMLVMSYLPINDNVGDYIGNLTVKWNLVAIDRHEEIEDLLKTYGAKYVFSGHMHSQNVLLDDDDDGSLTEYGTACLTCYPTAIRYFTANADGTLTASEKKLSALKEEYLPDYLDEETKQKVTTDLQAYGKEFVYENTADKIRWLFNESGTKENGYLLRLFRYACLYETEGVDNSLAERFAADLTEEIFDLLYMPIYGEGETMESTCKTYGVELPRTEYKSVMDLIATLMCDIYSDEVHIVGGCDEAIIIRYTVYQLCKSIADFDLFGRLAEINDTITGCDMHPIVDKLYETDILDVTINDFILHVLSIINVCIRKSSKLLRLNFKTTEDFLDAVADLLPIVLSILLKNDYNSADNTLWGIPFTDYINVPEGEINMQRLLDNFVIDVVTRDLIY